MNIGLDYDDTFTRDKIGWIKFIDLMRQRNHKVYIVTWRNEAESVKLYQEFGDFVDGVYPTNRLAKEPYMKAQGILIDVWIDDNPRAVIQDMEKL